VLAVTVAVVVLVVAGGTYLLVVQQLDRGQDVALLREATRIQRLIQTGSDFLASGSDSCRYAAEPACTRVVTAADHVESGDAAMHVTRAALDVAEHGGGPVYSTVAAPGRDVRVVVVPVDAGRAVMVGLPTTTTERTVTRVGTALLLLGALGILLSGVIGYIVAGIGLRPVRLLAAAVDRVARSRDPHVASLLDVRRNDELGRLSRSFRTMLDELASAQEAQRRLVQDASHELRTPLTTLRTNIALLERRDALPAETRHRLERAVADEVVALQSLVADLVDLARDGEATDPPQRVALADVVAAAVPVAARRWPSTRFRVRSTGCDQVLGSEAALERLVGVLLDNAGKHGGGGDVDVVVEHRDGVVGLAVSDRGPGIDEADLERVFDRFFRADGARRLPGSGLGLAIARRITDDHGGTVTASRRPGGGTTITVRMPAASS
jgi:two-component system sensor histidine kinase MprB